LSQDEPTGEYESRNRLRVLHRTEHKRDYELGKNHKKEVGEKEVWPPRSSKTF
jgi:hypothetical protein